MSNNKNRKKQAAAKKPAVALPTNMNRRSLKIVSGGQTGVDRGALQAAMDLWARLQLRRRCGHG